MEYKTLITKEENEVLAHVVFKEHTLGYLYRLGKNLYIGILHASVLKGCTWSILPDDILIASWEFEHVREATQEDFDDYRVSSKGHLTENQKTVSI